MHVHIYTKNEQIHHTYHIQPLDTSISYVSSALFCPAPVLSVLESVFFWEKILKGMKLHLSHVMITYELALNFRAHYKGCTDLDNTAQKMLFCHPNTYYLLINV